MPDTVNPLESISLIVNRHVAVADCAQSRSGRTNHRRKSSRSLTDAYNRFARHARSAKTANPWADFAEFGSTRNRQTRTSAKSTHIHLASSIADSRAKWLSNTSGCSSTISKLRCFALMKPSCTA